MWSGCVRTIEWAVNSNRLNLHIWFEPQKKGTERKKIVFSKLIWRDEPCILICITYACISLCIHHYINIYDYHLNKHTYRCFERWIHILCLPTRTCGPTHITSFVRIRRAVGQFNIDALKRQRYHSLSLFFPLFLNFMVIRWIYIYIL